MRYAATEDVHDAARYEAETPEAERITARGIEVGQTFFFGDKYSRAMKAGVTGPDGVEHFAQMGSYGVGVSRLLGAIIEASHDDAGIIWPDAVAPFGVGIVNLRAGDAACDAACETAYAALDQGRQGTPPRRHRRTPRRQVRRHGPDRPALAADRRAEGAGGGHGGAEAAGDGGAKRGVHGRGASGDCG